MSNFGLRMTAALICAIAFAPCAASDLVVSVSHTCDKPFDVIVTVTNNSARTIRIRRPFMPFNPRSGNVNVVARAFGDGSSFDIQPTGLIVETRPDEEILRPNRSIKGTFNLSDYYDVKGLESKSKVFNISFPRFLVYKNERYGMSAPFVSIYIEKSRIFGSACPIVTVK